MSDIQRGRQIEGLEDFQGEEPIAIVYRTPDGDLTEIRADFFDRRSLLVDGVPCFEYYMDVEDGVTNYIPLSDVVEISRDPDRPPVDS